MSRIDTIEFQSDEQTGQEHQSLEKIREILFGQQQRESTERLGRLSERLVLENQELREELSGRIEAVDRALKAQYDSLRSQLETSEARHERQLESLRSALREAESRWDARAQSLGDDFKQSQESLKAELTRALGLLDESLRLADGHLRVDLDQSILSLGGSLRSTLSAQKVEADEALAHHAEEHRAALALSEAALRQSKVDRSSLAAVFTELAARIQQDGA